VACSSAVAVERIGRVVVTGATGFIGAHLIRRLRRERLPVIAVVRTAPGGVAERELTYVERDLERVESIRDVLRPDDVVVHLAARAHVMRPGDQDADARYRRANVDPTRMICRSAVESGARRVVYMSSAKVFGEGRERPYDRAETVAPVDAYARSKAEAEQVVREVAGTGGVQWTIFRPPFVYGPGGKGNFPRLIALARLASRLPLPLASVANRRSILFVGNLVDAVVRCGLDDRAADAILLPTDALDVSTPQLLRAIATARASRALLFPFPPTLLRAAAALVHRSAEMDRLTESLRLDARHLHDDLAWRPPFSLEAALERSVAPFHEDARAADA